ncbi:hypothetical protein HOY82DRAFT_605523 [Tuber indicum]|nr:hypothetical protein HOY82DRAFT_605523 [Tuber indicum]
MASVCVFRWVTRDEAMPDFPEPGPADSQRRPDVCFASQSVYFGCWVTQAHAPAAGSGMELVDSITGVGIAGVCDVVRTAITAIMAVDISCPAGRTMASISNPTDQRIQATSSERTIEVMKRPRKERSVLGRSSDQSILEMRKDGLYRRKNLIGSLMAREMIFDKSRIAHHAWGIDTPSGKQYMDLVLHSRELSGGKEADIVISIVGKVPELPSYHGLSEGIPTCKGGDCVSVDIRGWNSEFGDFRFLPI